MKLEYKPNAANVVVYALSRAPTDGKMTGRKKEVIYRGIAARATSTRATSTINAEGTVRAK